eukprot:s25_g13.t1
MDNTTGRADPPVPMIAGKAAGMGKSKRKAEGHGGSIRKPTAVSSMSAEKKVPVDKALPGITSQVEYPSLQAASNKSTTGTSQGHLSAFFFKTLVMPRKPAWCSMEHGPRSAEGSLPSSGLVHQAVEQVEQGSAATQTVAAIAEKIQTKVEAMRPQREQLKRCVEACLTEALAGNTIEVVGSTAWGGEVPQQSPYGGVLESLRKGRKRLKAKASSSIFTQEVPLPGTLMCRMCRLDRSSRPVDDG